MKNSAEQDANATSSARKPEANPKRSAIALQNTVDKDIFEFEGQNNERMSDVLSSKFASVEKFDPVGVNSNDDIIHGERSNTNNESFAHLNKQGGEEKTSIQDDEEGMMDYDADIANS